jgi:hypothetical protein
LLLAAVQSYVVGAYALHASLGGCGAQELLMALDDAISDTMREWDSIGDWSVDFVSHFSSTCCMQ